jgi:2-polyprenyl-3-methyl-5-hydroxy-6-metoxy-1,4-benzoquinol methylase
MRAAWNELSGWYQARHQIPVESAHYGPWAPLENDERLLGNVQGLRILEVGCGGGQCSIAFARQGATCAGIDLSDAQLAFARKLAAAHDVDIPFHQGSVEDLSAFASGAWDVVFSAYAFQYVEHLQVALDECARVLKPNGRLIISLDHPFRDCFFDEADDDLTIYASRSYYDTTPMHWTFGDTRVPMVSYHRTFAQWFAALHQAGFAVQQLLEPAPPAQMLDEIWPYDDALSALRHIPVTVIFVTQKRPSPPPLPLPA